MAGNAALWQVAASAADGTEATATANTGTWASGAVILFNETPISSSMQQVVGSEFNIRNSVPENPRVFADGNELQDMGLDGVDITITGQILDSDSSNEPIAKLMTWTRQAKTATGYTRGRFGLRLDDFPHFNIVPTADFGGAMQNLRFIRDPDNVNNVGFVMTLRIGGNITSWLLSNGF